MKRLSLLLLNLSLASLAKIACAGEVAPHLVVFTNDPPELVPLVETTPNVFENRDHAVRVSVTMSRAAELDLWNIAIENTGDSELRLEPGLSQGGLDRAAYPTYWDGTATETAVAGLSLPHLRNNIRRMAPWASLFGPAEGRLLGVDPSELRSYVATSLTEDQSGLQCQVTARLVLAPHQSCTVRFFSARYPVAYGGQREAVQRIHDAFPQAFVKDPATSDCVNGVSAQYWMARMSPESIPGQAPLEFLRRFYATWDWAYAPFKRTGDSWGREEWWDYTPFTSFKQVKAQILQHNFSFDEMSRDQFMEMRAQFFNRWQGFHGEMFYSPGGAWVEKQLADREFPDAIINDPDYSCVLDSWVTGWDREVTVLPWFTSYEKVLREDYRRIADTYNIGGVALDVARGGPRYRGPAIAQAIPERAYDTKGVFIDQGVGIAKFIEYLHTLPARGTDRKLAVIGNPETGGQTYTVTTRYDSGMFEGPPYHPNFQAVPLARYLLGHKTLTWWQGWSYTTYIAPNWKSQTRDEFVKTMRGLADYTIFSSFEYGALPTIPYQLGVPKLTRYIPEMLASNARGWQAVFPVRLKFDGESVQTARYGSGLRTRLFFGNPYDDARKLSATVESARLGDRAYVFAGYLNGPETLTNTFTAPDAQLSFPVPARQPVLLDVAAAFPTGFRGTVAASWRHDLYAQEITLHLDPAPREALTITLPLLPGFRLEEIQGDAAALASQTTANGFACELPPGTTQVRASYRSENLGFNREALFAFPFLDPEGDPTFAVTSPQLDLLEQSGLRERIAEYFTFYSRVALHKANPKPLVFAASAAGPAWSIRVDPAVATPSLSIEGTDHLLLSARNVAEAEHLIESFLRALDERYPVQLGFVGTWGMDGNMLNHFGMAGKTLPEN